MKLAARGSDCSGVYTLSGITEERKKNFHDSSATLPRINYWVVVRKDSHLKIKTYDDLKGLISAHVRGYRFSQKFEKLKSQFKILPLNDDRQDIAMLLRKRVDGVVIDKT